MLELLLAMSVMGAAIYTAAALRPVSSEAGPGWTPTPDLPCPWCHAATDETDPQCPSCHRVFGTPAPTV